MTTLEQRFLAKISVGDDCWEWLGKRFQDGYGGIRVNNKWERVHRVAYELLVGPIPVDRSYHGTCVLHRCDNPTCVRPSHLFLGSHADNMADRDMKERQRRKLSAADVLEIRERHAEGGCAKRLLASQYGVSRATISQVVNHKSWRHLS